MLSVVKKPFNSRLQCNNTRLTTRVHSSTPGDDRIVRCPNNYIETRKRMLLLLDQLIKEELEYFEKLERANKKHVVAQLPVHGVYGEEEYYEDTEVEKFYDITDYI